MSFDATEGYKPLDFGREGISGCINQEGRIIALNAYHPEHGYVTLTSAPPFTESERYNPQMVRAYRRSLVQQVGFGLQFAAPIVSREAWLQDDLYPCVRLTLADGSQAECLTYPAQGQGVVQRWKFSEPQTQISLSGCIWLQRSAYTQLTEGGPIPLSTAETQITRQDANTLTLHNAALQWAVCFNQGAAATNTDGSVTFQEHSRPAGHELTLAIGVGLDINQAEKALSAVPETAPPARQSPLWANVSDDRILRRGLAYSLLCSTPTYNEGICILTDHMILPLSWNRDAYYAARAFLSWMPEMWPYVRGHLLWMFEKAERISGLWGRSYLANGRLKDRGFQLDQQLFPVIELFEYVRITGDKQLLNRLGGQIPLLLAALERYRHPNEPLYRTDETPADDPVALPYPLSSHILLWYMLHLLSESGLPGDWSDQAESVRTAVYRHFSVEHIGTHGKNTILAYATDCAGQHHFYHDANDFPLVLAPVWGFCAADDPLWQATIDFAFSEANQGGYYVGHLGSVHTSAPWAMGDIQEMIAAKLLGNAERYDKAQTAVRMAAQWDGALSEAYDAATGAGAVVSRHWFVWPNAVYACLLLGAFDS